MIKHLPVVGSDHSPIIYSLVGFHKKFKPTRRFEAAWLTYADYSENLVQAWNSSEGSFITKCSQSKSKLWLWYSSKLNFKAKIKDLTHQIEDLQCNPSSPWTIAEETKLRKELEEWYNREEIYWKQRAKCNWLNYGDRSNRYFHISATNQKHKNGIYWLKDSHGEWCSDFDDLNEHLIMPCITDHENSMLCTPPLNLEIQQTLFSMNPLKAPGPDGLHALFFQNGWNVVGEDFCHFIRTLFVEPSRIASINDT
uniref:Uncharacterized protein n=1 Tax=Nelumbo nucifera TaxID=4432 RepID=A0A822XMB3_NELNU|nr:TPA_asm: hypothetical protein HUJ06_024197 [Nelumbo nucifera]